jgi:tetratricopeptide (TPR) repeat protein
MIRRALAVAAVVLATAVAAEESDPLPVPKEGPRQAAVTLYNQGVNRLLGQKYAEAQRLFEQALEIHEPFAEAHNNLAFSLRMQGAHNFERAMRHYARALQVNPRLAQAYMYRGALYTQVGDVAKARSDLAVLRVLDAALAAKLEKAIEEKTTRERDGISAQVDDGY